MVEKNNEIHRICWIAVLLIHLAVFKLVGFNANEAQNLKTEQVIKISMISSEILNISNNQLEMASVQAAPALVEKQATETEFEQPSLPLPQNNKLDAKPVKQQTKVAEKSILPATAKKIQAASHPEKTATAESQVSATENSSNPVASDSIGEYVAASHTATEQIPVISKPEYRSSNPPEYPQQAVLMGYEGVVKLRALVGSSGKPEEIKVVGSSGYGILDEEAVKAVSKWEFEPYINNGKFILSWVEVPVQFKLN